MHRLLQDRRAVGLRPARFAARFLQALARALERRRQRRALSGLSDAMLADIGLSRGVAARESERPFWR